MSQSTQRIQLSDEEGLPTAMWFDPSRATMWKEGTRFDGHNHVSLCSGDKFGHQALYRTATGRWVLNSWSQWQGSVETYQLIDARSAAAWFVANEIAEVPEELQAFVTEAEV
ncbi:MAG: hypothetical protein RBU30_17675 [Polyangia bacterium]|jgi:hypothetical protein|nr:hypothetical protein [Polyangia bacterium]